MQIIQFVFSVIIALCAVAMFCRSGNNAKSDKGCVGYVVGSYLLFSLFLVKLAYCEMKSKNDIL